MSNLDPTSHELAMMARRNAAQDAQLGRIIADSEAEFSVRHLKAYACLMWPHLNTGSPVVRSWYLDAIADHLDAVKRFLLGEPGGIQRLLISIIFRSAKSTMTSVAFPTWLWLHDPRLRILSGSYDYNLSERDTWASRLAMQSPTYQRLLAHQKRFRKMPGSTTEPLAWDFAGDQNTKGNYANTRGGVRIATQVGGGTGKGGRVIILDDALSIDGARSDAMVREANDWLWSTLWSRQDVPEATAFINAAHRTREDDPIGEALARDLGFEYLALPLCYDPALRRRATSIGFEDPRTRRGTTLAPKRWTEKVVADLRKSLRGNFQALAQQNPSSTLNKPIKRSMLIRWRMDLLPKFDKLVMSWDTAFKGFDPSQKTNANKKKKSEDLSWTVGQVWGIKGSRAYLLDQVGEQVDFIGQERMFETLYAKWKRTSYSLIEAEANGDALISSLGQRYRGLIPIDPRRQGSKFQRLLAVLPFFEAGNVLLPPDDAAEWVEAFVRRLLSFPSTVEPDDEVDCLSQLLRYEFLEEIDRDGSDPLGAARTRALAS